MTSLSKVKEILETTPLAGWQDISTAPKDGTKILVFVQSNVYGTAWQAVAWWSHIDDNKQYPEWVSPLGNGRGRIDSCTSDITHWKPLDPSPNATSNADEIIEKLKPYLREEDDAGFK